MKTTEPQTGIYWKTRSIEDDDRDWKYAQNDWVKDYWESQKHPHRKHILDAVEKLQPQDLAEVGANCGPNLALIHNNFPQIDLFGIDISPDAVSFGKKMLCKHIELSEGDFTSLPWQNNIIDVLLADAVLMYAKPDEIEDVLAEMCRVAKKALVIVDRCAEKSEVTGAVWAHPYKKILKKLGLSVTEKKLSSEDWPESPNWVKYGHIIVAKK